jgi:hypothetical protein
MQHKLYKYKLSNNSKSSINQNQSVGPLTALIRTNGYEEIYMQRREIKKKAGDKKKKAGTCLEK